METRRNYKVKFIRPDYPMGNLYMSINSLILKVNNKLKILGMTEMKGEYKNANIEVAEFLLPLL